MSGVARVGDHVAGTCPQHIVPVSYTGTWTSGSGSATANGKAIIRLGDTGVASCGHTFAATSASTKVSNGGVPVHRAGDAVDIIGGGPGTTIAGSSSVSAN
jgi:uncharacterized Zn-binding protein involved in type VI secretion